jgi:succinoglycan biosynthesis transport protein ExoP
MSQDNLVQFEDYVAAAKRQRKLISICVGACVLLSIIGTFLMPKTYTSEARVLVRPVLDPTDQTRDEVNIDTERGVAKSLSVAGIATTIIGTDASPSSVLSDLIVEPVTDSQILVFEYSAGDPDQAYEAADAFSNAYLQFRTQEADSAKNQVQSALEAEQSDLIQRRAGLLEQKKALPAGAPEQIDIDSELAVIESNDSAIRTDLAQLGSANVDAGTVIDQAEVPSAPSSPSLKVNLAAGLLIGAVLGLLLAFIKERERLGRSPTPTTPDPTPASTTVAQSEPLLTRDPTPALALTPSDRRKSVPIEAVLRQEGVPPLGEVPRLTNDADAPPFDSVTMLNGHVGESLRRLDSTISAQLEGTDVRVILVTTPEQRGMTVGLAGSLAVTAAQSGREVLLIGADLEQPTLHSRFQLTNGQGLVEALRGQRPLAQVMQGWGGYETLVVVTAGKVTSADFPVREDVLRNRLGSVRDDFQLVFIEAPPVLASPDAVTLASVSDAAILAVDPRGSHPERIAAAARELQAHTRLIGSVMVEARAPRSGSSPEMAALPVSTGHYR